MSDDYMGYGDAGYGARDGGRGRDAPRGRGYGGGYGGGGGGYGAASGGYPGGGGYGAPSGGYGGGGGYGTPYPPRGPPGGMDQSPLDAEIQVVIREIHTEQGLFDQSGEWGDQFKNAKRLLAAEADKLENSIDPEWLEVDIPKPIKVTKKVLIPNFRHPHFNFVGKLLGPKGATLQAMAKQHKCHIYVLGRGSTKDRHKEQELLASGDPQYAHYGGPLHVKVETIAPAHVAYQRIAGVLEVLAKTLVPVRDGPEKEGENGSGDAKEGNYSDGEEKPEAKPEASDRGNGGGRGGGRGGRGFRGGRGGGPMRGGRGGANPSGFRPY